MKVTIAIIGGLLFVGQGAYASTQNNPFLLPSERKTEVKEKTVIEAPVECAVTEVESENVQDLAALLAQEIKEKEDLPPEFQPAVLGNWTRADVESSRYIGLINGFKVYFHNEKRVFFSLDMSKAEIKDNEEKGLL